MSFHVLIADQCDVIRVGLRTLLERIPGCVVVGEAADGRRAVDLARELTPDMVLIEVTLPELNGIEAAQQIMALDTGIKIIAVSRHHDQRYVTDFVRAGAAGYVLKDHAGEELAQALRAVANGKTYLSPAIAGSMVHDYVRMMPENGRAVSFSLSAREREVLQQIAEGKTNKEIAANLTLSIKTIESHRAQVMEKLNIRTVAALTKFAVREGLTSLQE